MVYLTKNNTTGAPTTTVRIHNVEATAGYYVERRVIFYRAFILYLHLKLALVHPKKT